MNDQRIEQVIGNLLRAGVLFSAAVVLAGGVWLLVDSGRAIPAYGGFRGEPREYRSPSALVRGLAHPSPEALIQFGLLLLIATPVARVIFSLVAFAMEPDRMYVGFTLVVLAILLYSLIFTGP